MKARRAQKGERGHRRTRQRRDRGRDREPKGGQRQKARDGAAKDREAKGKGGSGSKAPAAGDNPCVLHGKEAERRMHRANAPGERTTDRGRHEGATLVWFLEFDTLRFKTITVDNP